MFKKYVPQPGRREYITFLLLLIEIVVFGLFAKNFFSPSNLYQVIQNAAEIALISIGMNIVIILGGIDLSVGSMLGVVGIIVGYMLEASINPILIVVTAIATGIFLGFINGFIVSKLKIPDFVTTLATMNLLRAAIFGLLGGKWLTGLPGVFTPVTVLKIWGIPVLLLIVIFAYVIFYFILNYTAFGRSIYAVGSNMNSAKLAGINIDRVKLISYSILGGIVGIATIFYVARMGSVEMTVGSNTALDCIAAVIIGGTGIKGKGGKGTLVGTFAGVFFIAFMYNGVVILGVPSLLENFIIGLLIIVALLSDIVINSQGVRKMLSKKQYRKVNI
ncbi:MAG: ABC transporter permease [Ruminiclostridium sp.]